MARGMCGKVPRIVHDVLYMYIHARNELRQSLACVVEDNNPSRLDES